MCTLKFFIRFSQGSIRPLCFLVMYPQVSGIRHRCREEGSALFFLNRESLLTLLGAVQLIPEAAFVFSR
jgi:hypothetical protein